MQFDYAATGRFMWRQLVRRCWTTTHQKWATSFLLAGFAIATCFVPHLGIAVFGTAFAGWWLTVFVVTMFFWLLGSRLGVEREKSALERQVQGSGSAGRL